MPTDFDWESWAAPGAATGGSDLAAAAARYAANPMSPEFIGVDPKIFGYPPDLTAGWPSGYGGGDFASRLASLLKLVGNGKVVNPATGKMMWSGWEGLGIGKLFPETPNFEEQLFALQERTDPNLPIPFESLVKQILGVAQDIPWSTRIPGKVDENAMTPEAFYAFEKAATAGQIPGVNLGLPPLSKAGGPVSMPYYGMPPPNVPDAWVVPVQRLAGFLGGGPQNLKMASDLLGPAMKASPTTVTSPFDTAGTGSFAPGPMTEASTYQFAAPSSYTSTSGVGVPPPLPASTLAWAGAPAASRPTAVPRMAQATAPRMSAPVGAPAAKSLFGGYATMPSPAPAVVPNYTQGMPITDLVRYLQTQTRGARNPGMIPRTLTPTAPVVAPVGSFGPVTNATRRGFIGGW